jgi:ABC-type dipeptide/oligopeptide/nickel transport system ATPase component
MRFVDSVNNRINSNKNCLICIVGDTGSGKSYASLRIGEVLDPTFNIDRVVFSAESFMKLLNEGDLRKGNVIIWDEAGAGGGGSAGGMAHREWWSKANQAINYVMQTFRNKNLITIFTTPSAGFVDKDMRDLFHYVINMRMIDRVKKVSVCNVKRIQHNPVIGKTYRKNLRDDENGYDIIYNSMEVSLPSKVLRIVYERKSAEFKKILREEMEGRIKHEKIKSKKKIVDIDKIEKEVKDNPEKYKNSKGNISRDLIRHFHRELTYRDAEGIAVGMNARKRV